MLHQRQNASNASTGARIKINTCWVYIALEYVGTVTFNLGTVLEEPVSVSVHGAFAVHRWAFAIHLRSLAVTCGSFTQITIVSVGVL